MLFRSEDGSGDKRLVAYIVMMPGASSGPKELRNYLATRLPDYMMPSLFVFLERLPHTPNGKIDRRNLPPPEGTLMAAADRFAAPRNPVEQIVAEVWAELLGIERVGVEDNFFELGGHSLMATQLITRLRQIFQIDLPLAIIFKTPTVSAVAQFMTDHEAKPGLTEKTALIFKRISEMPAAISASTYGPA